MHTPKPPFEAQCRQWSGKCPSADPPSPSGFEELAAACRPRDEGCYAQIRQYLDGGQSLKFRVDVPPIYVCVAGRGVVEPRGIDEGHLASLEFEWLRRLHNFGAGLKAMAYWKVEATGLIDELGREHTAAGVAGLLIVGGTDDADGIEKPAKL
ncbi:hypothetical protein WG66_005396 [Moniliophthora roreri]|nr:hypothetical protein WG66_005396 [Moniliophthora roreri]